MASPLTLKRTHIIKVRFNRSELDQFIHMAGDCQLASYARRSLLDQQLPLNQKPPKRRVSSATANTKLTREIALIGNNLNQIARSLNSHLKHKPDESLNILVVAHLLEMIWERLCVQQGV